MWSWNVISDLRQWIGSGHMSIQEEQETSTFAGRRKVVSSIYNISLKCYRTFKSRSFPCLFVFLKLSIIYMDLEWTRVENLNVRILKLNGT